jgi:hypothetical protein
MKLEPGTILWLEDAHWQRGFQIHEQLGRRNSSVYSAISLDEVGKPLAVHVGAHPSQLEPSWEDMSTWYQVCFFSIYPPPHTQGSISVFMLIKYLKLGFQSTVEHIIAL